MSRDKRQKKEKNEKLAEFIRYLVVGFATTGLNWVVNALCVECTDWGKTEFGSGVASVIAWIVSTLFFAFWAYKFIVFRSKSMAGGVLWLELVEFTSARLLTLGVEFLIIFIFCTMLGHVHIVHVGFTRIVDGVAVGDFGINIREVYIIKFFACVVVTILNYIFSKLVVFKKGQRENKNLEAERDEGETAL